MRKAIENKCSTCTAGMSSGKILKYQLPSTEKILPVLTEPSEEMQIDFYGKLLDKHITGEPYNLFGIDPSGKWPVVRVWKSTETKAVIKFFESLINVYGVPENIKSDRGSAFIS